MIEKNGKSAAPRGCAEPRVSIECLRDYYSDDAGEREFAGEIFTEEKRMLAKYNDLLLRLFVAFGLLTAITGIAQYISGKQVNDALEETIETLKNEQQGRHLSEAQFGQLTSELRAIPKTNIPITVNGSQGNVESVKFGMKLMQALKDAGFPVSGVGEVWAFGGGIGSGVQIRSAEAARGIARSIGIAFEKAGVTSVQAPDINLDHLTGDSIEIFGRL